VINPTDLPPNVVPAAASPDEIRIPLDPKNWELITDAMADVVSPIGTAGMSAVKGIDIAGKTGSAQTISNVLKAKLGALGKAKYKDNGWFVGVEPRRNPEIVVCALFEEGEHGSLAAHVVSDVIKAYVEKQRRQPTKVAGSGNGKAEIGAVWNDGGADDDGGSHLQGGRFFVDVSRKPAPLAVAAPGLH
jgi:penicillin-binding protein 2